MCLPATQNDEISIKEGLMKRFRKNLGMLLAAIWFIAWGLVSLVPALGGLGPVLAILAIAAGVLLLLGR